MAELNPAPEHVAIIMDGNGRWAKKRGFPRIRGHEEGGNRIEEIIDAAPKLGIKYLTLYAFSKENWQRPKQEVSFLMKLLSRYLDQKREELQKKNMVFRTIGRIHDLPQEIQSKIERNTRESANNTGMTVTFAFSYSSRLEITDACREIAEKVMKGDVAVNDINEQLISDHLYTAGTPDPDLLIRTSGELRISNFLLWQISYAELYITDKLWPDFGGEDLEKAVEAFKKRERRFGKSEVEPQKSL